MAKKVEQTGNIKPTESQYATVNADELLSANAPATAHAAETLYNQQNYTLMVIGLVLVILGFFLMRGGAMPDANTWDESIIYSTTRVTIAPLVVLIGLCVEVYAIFKK
jgi:hypothetical protein